MAKKIKGFFGFVARLFKPQFGLDKFQEVANKHGLSKKSYDIAANVAALLGADNTVKADLGNRKNAVRSKIDCLRSEIAQIAKMIETFVAKKASREDSIAPQEGVLAELEAIEKLIN